MQLSPGMDEREAAATEGGAQQGQDEAMVNYVMSLDPAKVEPQWRYSLSRIQNAIGADPTKAIDVAKGSGRANTGRLGCSSSRADTTTGRRGNTIPISSVVAVDLDQQYPAGGNAEADSRHRLGGPPSGRAAGSPPGLSPSAAALAKRIWLGGTAPVMADDTLEIPGQPPKLRALLADPAFLRLKAAASVKITGSSNVAVPGVLPRSGMPRSDA